MGVPRRAGVIQSSGARVDRVMVVTNIRTLTFSFSFHEGAKMNGSIDIADEAVPIILQLNMPFKVQ